MGLCKCDNPKIDECSEYGDGCAKCGNTIGYPIIGGKIHAGYSELGNDQEFFEAKERDLSGSPHDGGVNRDGYYRDFMAMEVVLPVEHDLIRRLGTEWVSFDHVIEEDGSVDLIVYNRRLENLPGGPKFPIEDNSV